MFRQVGMAELLIILVVVLLLFGATKLPNLGTLAGRLREGIPQGRRRRCRRHRGQRRRRLISARALDPKRPGAVDSKLLSVPCRFLLSVLGCPVARARGGRPAPDGRRPGTYRSSKAGSRFPDRQRFRMKRMARMVTSYST